MDTVYTCTCGNARVHKPKSFHTCDLPMCCGKLMASHERMDAKAIQAEVQQRWEQAPSQSDIRSYWWLIYCDLTALTDHNYPSHITAMERRLKFTPEPEARKILQETLKMLRGTQEES